MHVRRIAGPNHQLPQPTVASTASERHNAHACRRCCCIIDSRSNRLDKGTRMTTILTAPEGAWNAPATGKAPSERQRHIVCILLQNESGALTRVTSLFATRAYNIESLNVAPTDDPTISRITLVTTGSQAVVQQIVNQLLKLIDVVNVDDMTRDQHVERELLLLKLRLQPQRLAEFGRQVQQAGGRVLADEPEGYTVEITDSEARINEFIAASAQYGEVIEVVRSGPLAMLRGAGTLRT